MYNSLKIFTKSLLGLTTLSLLIFSCSDQSESKTKSTVTQNEKEQKNTPVFELLNSTNTGVDFSNSFSPEKELEFYKFQYQFNGGGVGIGDFNNDGLSDVFFCGNEVSNKLYINKGDLKFEDVSASAGIELPNKWCNGICVVDINSDGLLDIYLSVGGNKIGNEKANALLINNGDMTFTEKAQEFGIADTGWSTQSLFFDFDLDNDLDLFVLNHPNIWFNETRLSRKNYETAVVGADHFYINNNGKFEESTKKVGLKSEIMGGHGLGVSAGDLDQNGYMDIYVSNDYDSPDYLYMNQGNGTFKEEVKKRTEHIAFYSMGNDIADFNNDGFLDILAVDMSAEDHVRLKTQMGAMAPDKFYEMVNFGLPRQYMYNTLQLNNGNGTFSDIAQIAGVSSTDWSWSPLFADFDNDGYKDLLVTNGYRLDDRDNDYLRLVQKKYGSNGVSKEGNQREIFDATPSTPLTNYVYKNNGDFTFSKKSYEWGLGKKSFTQGAAFADLDNDGDLDLVFNNMEDKASIYRNNSNSNQNGYVQVKMEENDGVASGAIVTLQSQNNIQTQQFQPYRGYMSSIDRVIHFGISNQTQKMKLSIKWADGKTSKYTVEPNSVLTVNKQNAVVENSIRTENNKFKTIANNLGIDYNHAENKYNDFDKEILLPHKNSMHGPALAKGDLNGDGLEDLFIGGAHTYSGAVYIQQKDGTFKNNHLTSLVADKAHEDVGALIYDYDGDGDLDLYVASGGNEFVPNDNLYKDRLYQNDGKGNLTKTKGVLPNANISGKNVSAGDFDNDGDLDLFVGGRLVPAKYPFAPKSRLLKFHGGKYLDVTKEVAPELDAPGLVTNSVWADIDNDHDLDLIVIGEWMPIMVMENENNKLTLVKNNLSELSGWWRGVEASDYDNDGDIDFIVGNLGLNYKYKASKNEPFQIWCHDFDESGSLDIVLGYYDHGTCYPVRGRTCSSQQMPFIKEKFPTFNEFANATIADVYGDKLGKALNLKANTFESVYIENLGNKNFKVSQLPNEVQFSMITSIQRLNTKNNGQTQVVVAGNLHNSEVETPRADAGIGVLLELQDGKWVSKMYPETGLYVSGDVKNLVSIETSTKRILVVAKNSDKPQVIEVID